MPAPDLAAVEAAVQAALRRPDRHDIRLLGHGEVSMVIGWPTDAPAHAVKRVAPFSSQEAADGYVDACEQFLATMHDRGVAVVPTTVHRIDRDDGSVVVYHVQPALDPQRIGTALLATEQPSADHPLLAAIVAAAVRAIDDRTGLDCQVANWWWQDGVAHQLDVTSPFLVTEDGRDLIYDSRGFLAEYPVVLRRLLRRELLDVVRRFTTPQGALSDMVANLFKEGLDGWVEPAIAATAAQGVPLDRGHCMAMYRADMRLFPVALRLKKMQRAWMHATRRPYESLLPTATTYRRR